MWRPEGWKTIPPEFECGKHECCAGDGCLACRDHVNYEAGADALLTRLRATGRDMGDMARQLALSERGQKGKVVFIPDEKP